jgi:hypothetical protein
MGIFKRKAARRFDPEPFSGLQKGVRIWLAARIVALRNDSLQSVEQTTRSEIMLYIFAAR